MALPLPCPLSQPSQHLMQTDTVICSPRETHSNINRRQRPTPVRTALSDARGRPTREFQKDPETALPPLHPRQGRH